MRQLSTVVIFSMISLAVLAQMNPRDVLNEAHQLTEQQQYKEALEKYIWFHDHALDQNEDLYGVRLSFALSDWVKLSEKYPEALTALEQIRDKKTRLLMEGIGSRTLFHDILAINRALEETAKTRDLFLHLDSRFPAQAASYWSIARTALDPDKDIDLIRKYQGVPGKAPQKPSRNHSTREMKSPLIGEWFGLDTTRGGLGTIRIYDDRGTVINESGAILQKKYKVKDGKLILLNENGSVFQKYDLTLGQSSMILKGIKSGREQNLDRIEGDGSKGIVGKWKGPHKSGADQIMHFTTFGNCYFIVQMLSDTGTYFVNGDFLRETYPEGNPFEANFSVNDDILTLTPPGTSQPQKYARKH